MYLHGRNTGEAKAADRYENIARIDEAYRNAYSSKGPGWHR